MQNKLKQFLFCWVVVVTSETDDKLNLYSSSYKLSFFLAQLNENLMV